MSNIGKIVVVGLGYVGLPLAVALARKFEVIGFDVDSNRIAQLRAGHDRTREIDGEELKRTRLELTDSVEDCRGAGIYIVTVPTPVDDRNQPDLSAVLSATRMIAEVIDPARRPTIVYESTVYPGVTEEICGAELERAGHLQRGRDFRLGYSPERINPGDRTHSIDKITKVIAAEDSEVLEQLADMYGAITSGGVEITANDPMLPALSNRNWPISFSITTADCVFAISPPSPSNTVSPPESSPI